MELLHDLEQTVVYLACRLWGLNTTLEEQYSYTKKIAEERDKLKKENLKLKHEIQDLEALAIANRR